MARGIACKEYLSKDIYKSALRSNTKDVAQKPAKRHVIADVRLQCGLSQAELGEVLGYKKVTIQKIEQGHLAMSEELAEQAEKQLDVSAAWLLENNPDSAPVTPRGGRWTKELFEFAQGARSAVTEKTAGGTTRGRVRAGPYPLKGAADEFTQWKLCDVTSKIHALIAGTRGSPSQGILLHRLNTALKQLTEQFPADQSILAKYQPQLNKLRSAYDKTEREISYKEHKRMWAAGEFDEK
ncbi:MAG TPA: helix-turn-helix transcriptional regulator [Chthoniobacterales bacterium]|nr:helix-turn-helix transcriptional regulator [Chthoniobacterales bacterium]